jgi:hypothetical protein
VIAGAAVRPTDALVMGAQTACVKKISPEAAVKINYPEDVVLRLARSTGCRQNLPGKRSKKCSTC